MEELRKAKVESDGGREDRTQESSDPIGIDKPVKVLDVAQRDIKNQKREMWTERREVNNTERDRGETNIEGVQSPYDAPNGDYFRLANEYLITDPAPKLEPKIAIKRFSATPRYTRQRRVK